MTLTLIEKETIILFNEAEKDAEIYTNNDKLRGKLEQAALHHPEIYQQKNTNGYGGATYVFPKKWLTVLFREPISEERRKNLSELGKQRNMDAIRRSRTQ